LLFEIAAETLRTIAADPKTSGRANRDHPVLHTWGSALTHHPHVHGIVPGGGLSLDGERWISFASRASFIGTRASRGCFGRRFLEELSKAHVAWTIAVLREYTRWPEATALPPTGLSYYASVNGVVLCQTPFAGPEAGIGVSFHVILTAWQSLTHA